MSCKLEEELTAYVDGELNQAEAKTVRAHLTECADCRSTEALLRRTLQTLAALPAFEPSLGLRRTVLGRLDAVRTPFGERFRGWLRPGVLLPSTVGLLAAGVVALFVAGPASQKNLPAELQDGAALDVAMNYDVVSNYEVLGLESPDDIEVVARLDELEGRP
jgi:anti-sigma factor RsiW